MVRRVDAPPPGWYPDPTGGSGLWWWDGLDWTRHRRPPPSSLDGGRPDGPAPTDQAWSEGDRSVPTATQLRSRGAVGQKTMEQQVAAATAEARRVAKAEVDKAVADARRQLGATTDRLMPRLDQYRARLRRWSRIAVVVVIAFVVLTTYTSARFQVGLFEWIGDRIDAATGVVLVDERSTHGLVGDVLDLPALR